MDKKQKVAIVSPKPLLLEAGHPSSDEKAVSPLENANPSSEEMNTQANSGKSSTKRKKRERSAVVRRSQRLLNATTTPARNEDSKHLTEHLNIGPDKEDEPSESEEDNKKDEPSASEEDNKEDEPSASEEDNQPEPKPDARDMEEHIKCLHQLFQEQKDKIEALKSKVMNDCAATNVSYKNLYLDGQKKLEALQEEKQQLVLKLENALTKIELYEKGTQVFTEALDKLKDVIMSASNLSEAATPSTAAGQEAKKSSSKKKRTDK